MFGPLPYFVAFYLACWFSAIAALVTHIVISIKAGAVALLIFGVIIPPIGVIHGYGHWFGAW